MKEYNNMMNLIVGLIVYLIDRGFRITNALNIIVNQCKYPGTYNECFCLGCSKDLRSSFANNDNVNNNVNDNDNDKDKDNDNDNVIDNENDNDKDNANDNDNDNVNDLRSSFANNDNDNNLPSSFANNVNDNDNDRDNFKYLFGDKHRRVKPNNKKWLNNNISVE